MSDLKNSLIEVRKAYRLLYDYQSKILNLVQFIGLEFGLSYSGGISRYCNPTPRNGKGTLDSWAWDWLNMYHYEFTFYNIDKQQYFSVVLVSDTGFFEGNYEMKSPKNKLVLENYKNVEQSKTKLVFIAGFNIMSTHEFYDNDIWKKEEYIKKEKAIEPVSKTGKIFYKSYNLEEFANNEKALEVLENFSKYCVDDENSFKLMRDKEEKTNKNN
jgi:hypothetical protein